MNLYQKIFINVILLLFPILIYLIYLSTDKNINKKEQKLYLTLSLYASFFLLFKYSFNDRIVDVLLLTSIIILFILEDMWKNSIIFTIISLFCYSQFNNIYILFIGILISLIFYYLKIKYNIITTIFIQIYTIIISLTFFIWIYLFNNEYLNIDLFLLLVTNIFVINIICLMYGVAKKVLKSHLSYKELQKEKQIRLSLFKITHEIKNPIAVIKGYLDMLDVEDKKQVKKYIPIIKSETDRILTILQDFLLINKMNLDLDIMDINMLIEDVIFKLEGVLKEKNVKLNLHLIDDEVYINGDYNRLSQVFINIIKNSIEAINNKGKIDIKSKIVENKLEITITDDGVGISKDVINKIKEPFYTTKSRGSGLGVSLIYEIIEAHKGSVVYKSDYNVGTKVIIKLPIYE